MKIAVLDIGGTSIKAGIYENGSLRDCREFATDAYLGGESVMRKAIGILKGCCGFERIGISTAGQVDGRHIFARIGEPQIRETVDSWIDEILYGLITLIHIFNPPCVILGGGVMSQTYIIEEIRKKLGKQIMPSFRDVVILPAQLKNTAGLLGAGKCAEGADTLHGK